MRLNTYLTFDGNAEEAMRYYHQILGGELSIRRFSDGPMEVAESHKSKVMHALLKHDDFEIMASDTDGSHSVHVGNNFSLSLFEENGDKAASIFEALSANGQTLMPLNEVFWGGRFGMCVDQFGNQWMVSCP